MYALSAALISWPLASVYFDAMRTAALRETAVLIGAGAHLCPTWSAVVHTAENIIREAKIALDMAIFECSVQARSARATTTRKDTLDEDCRGRQACGHTADK